MFFPSSISFQGVPKSRAPGVLREKRQQHAMHDKVYVYICNAIFCGYMQVCEWAWFYR